MPLAQFNLNVNETVESGINNHPFKVSENLHSRIISEEESGQGLYFERNIIQKNEKEIRLSRLCPLQDRFILPGMKMSKRIITKTA